MRQARNNIETQAIGYPEGDEKTQIKLSSLNSPNRRNNNHNIHIMCKKSDNEFHLLVGFVFTGMLASVGVNESFMADTSTGIELCLMLVHTTLCNIFCQSDFF